MADRKRHVSWDDRYLVGEDTSENRIKLTEQLWAHDDMGERVQDLCFWCSQPLAVATLPRSVALCDECQEMANQISVGPLTIREVALTVEETDEWAPKAFPGGTSQRFRIEPPIVLRLGIFVGDHGPYIVGLEKGDADSTDMLARDVDYLPGVSGGSRADLIEKVREGLNLVALDDIAEVMLGHAPPSSLYDAYRRLKHIGGITYAGNRDREDQDAPK